MVRQRQPAPLDPWLKRVTTSTLEALQRFATGLYEDYAAVKAGVTLPWSASPVEGHINRLNMLKRQMFGRTCLDLLSRRFVRIPGRGHEGAQRGQESSKPTQGPQPRIRAFQTDAAGVACHDHEDHQGACSPPVLEACATSGCVCGSPAAEHTAFASRRASSVAIAFATVSRSGSPNPAARAARHPASGMTDTSAVQRPAACRSHCQPPGR